MRLTIVNQFYAPDLSPTAQLAASLAEHRALHGDDVTVVAGTGAYAGGQPVAPPATSSNPRVRRAWTPSFGRATVLRRLADYLVFFAQAKWTLLTLPAQDVIVLMTTPPYVALTGLAHKLLHPRTRLILWSMDCYPETLVAAGALRERGLPARLLRALTAVLFRWLDDVVTLDAAMEARLSRSYARDGAPRFAVLPNWEPAARFPPGSRSLVWGGFERLGLRGKSVIVYQGNAGAGHRFDTVMEACRRLADDYAFVFVGGGSAWEALHAARLSGEIANLHLEPYVPAESVAGVLAGAQAALITLRDEMLGVMSPSKLHAALAMGVPIVYVGPAGGNVHEAIERFGCGVSLRHGDVDGLVAFLERLRAQPALRAELSARARAAFEAAYSDSAGLARFDALLGGPTA
ncbi:MAG: glycosyltransferase family 4 protein [Chloroflexi bacterium]|nr:glycosyltransferase family 4 protein [Chloroflexota bacterium]